MRIQLFTSYIPCAFALHCHSSSRTTDDSTYNLTTRSNGCPSVQPQFNESTCESFWLEHIKHQGNASFNPDTSYRVFRNVKDYGAVGDGFTDDTSAIQRAITDGARCAPGVCESSTITPATVYFPAGTYLVSSPIIDYYYTQIIGNPNCLPTLLAASNFDTTKGLGLIDGSPYQSNGRSGFRSTNIFFRQIRNLVFDMTRIPAEILVRGLHWPTAQTTSLQNLVFRMSSAQATQHEGLFIEEGSGGFMTDLVFDGGKYGFNVGNQQFTTRNVTFRNCDTAVHQLWDWGWTYKSVHINNCRVGLDFSAGGRYAVSVGSITLLDSSITNTPIGILTARTGDSKPNAAGSLYMENVKFDNVTVPVKILKQNFLKSIPEINRLSAWIDGRLYSPEKHIEKRGFVRPSTRPPVLLDEQGKYYERSKPQYGNIPLSGFLSARDLGAQGDGITDDTEALNAAIIQAAEARKILFIDAGFYKVTNTGKSCIVGRIDASVINISISIHPSRSENCRRSTGISNSI